MIGSTTLTSFAEKIIKHLYNMQKYLNFRCITFYGRFYLSWLSPPKNANTTATLSSEQLKL